MNIKVLKEIWKFKKLEKMFILKEDKSNIRIIFIVKNKFYNIL